MTCLICPAPSRCEEGRCSRRSHLPESLVRRFFGRTLRAIGALLPLVCLIILSGCASAPHRKTPEVFWPDPPDEPRIKYVDSFAGADYFPKSGWNQFKGSLLGKQAAPALSQPMGIAVTGDGKRAYVSDYANGIVFVFDFAWKKVWFIGTDERYPLNRPMGDALDGAGNLYVADSFLKVVRVYTKDGKFVQNIGVGKLERPTSVAVDEKHNKVYVCDAGQQKTDTHRIQAFDLKGKFLQTIGTRGSGDGEFYFPTYIAVDDEGRLYVVDTMNFRVQIFGPDGKFVSKFGENTTEIGGFMRAKGIALDHERNLYVADSNWSGVEIFNPEGKLLLFFGGYGAGAGMMQGSTAIAIDRSDRIYVCDTFGNRVNVYQRIK